MNTYAEIIRTREGDPKVGLRFEGRSWTWEEVVAEAATRAAVLDTFSPGPGRTQKHVGVLLQNVPDYVFWLLAAGLTGDVLVGVNSTRRGEELAQDIRHTDCDLLITEPLYSADLAELALPIPPERVYDISSEAYAKLLAPHRGASLPQELPDPAAMLLLLFSSGSTGAPKAVICTQGRLAALTGKMTERVSLRRDSVTHLSMPLFHGNSVMMNLSTAVQVGATIVMVRKFSASGFIRDIHEYDVTFFNYVGRLLSYILATPADPRDRDSALEVAFGSEASPAEISAFTQRFGVSIREGYGASEGIMRITPVPGSPPNSLGRPAEGLTVELRNEAGEVCPPAQIDEYGMLLNAAEATGEIVAVGRGAFFEGYYKNPEAMADRLKGDGQDFWSGDLAYRDPEGYLYFAGRSSDWIRVDGENFATAPVERIVSRYTPFTGALGYAVPDPHTGDQLMLSVLLAEGAVFDPDDFAEFLAAQSDLGTKWKPRFVRVVDTIPMTANGKVSKIPLRATGWDAPHVWWMPPRTDAYVPFGHEARAALRAEFHRAGRTALLPATPDTSVVNS
ncbi:MAG: AMP-binding protein [Actinomycetota bacterium]|nr:AMP-binding protein [Actinomycetota bacterium]